MMPVRRVAVLSVHTSPLAQPGAGDGGGMNVYVRALATGLAHAGVECDVFTRRESRDEPTVTRVEEGFRVVHIDAGPSRIEIVPPGVDHSVFRPSGGDGALLRKRLGVGDRPLLLFVGRIQPLKGVDVAIRALAALEDSSSMLVVVGGPSGPSGPA